MTKLGRINKTIEYFTLGDSDFVDSKNYGYKYKKVNDVNDIIENIGNIYDLLPKDTGSMLNVNEFSIIKDKEGYNPKIRITIKIYGENNVKMAIYANRKSYKWIIKIDQLRDSINELKEYIF